MQVANDTKITGNARIARRLVTLAQLQCPSKVTPILGIMPTMSLCLVSMTSLSVPTLVGKCRDVKVETRKEYGTIGCKT
jgi:hypothetical protein